MVMSYIPPRRHLSVCHAKTLKMSEDVLCVCHSPDGRLLAVALLDTTVKVFFTDSLKVSLVQRGSSLTVVNVVSPPVLSLSLRPQTACLVHGHILCKYVVQDSLVNSDLYRPHRTARCWPPVQQIRISEFGAWTLEIATNLSLLTMTVLWASRCVTVVLSGITGVKVC